MNLHMRKQRRRSADQRLCFRYTDITIPLLSKPNIPSLLLSSVTVQPTRRLTSLPTLSFSYHDDKIDTRVINNNALISMLRSIFDIKYTLRWGSFNYEVWQESL